MEKVFFVSLFKTNLYRYVIPVAKLWCELTPGSPNAIHFLPDHFAMSFAKKCTVTDPCEPVACAEILFLFRKLPCYPLNSQVRWKQIRQAAARLLFFFLTYGLKEHTGNVQVRNKISAHATGVNWSWFQRPSSRLFPLYNKRIGQTLLHFSKILIHN